MTAIDATDAGETAGPEKPEREIDWPLIACVGGAVLIAGTAIAAWQADFLDLYLNRSLQHAAEYIAFAIAALLPLVACWMRSIKDGKLPARHDLEPKYEHVSGWSAVFLFVVMGIIAGLVWWASDRTAIRRIHAEWGTWTVVGLSVAFIVVASAPFFPRIVRVLGIEGTVTKWSNVFSDPIDGLGRWLSSTDGVLVFAVANAAGANRPNFFVRYAILLASISACAALGYYWDAPWAFIPLAWGFLIAVAVSRRWAWIEGDRELSMLNPTLPQIYVRVGFSQNLRDEALVVFLSMFLLVPLALRQAQLLAQTMGVHLFDLAGHVDVHSLSVWIGFYGTELAKAVPFVDWAEVYHVEGDAPIIAKEPWALHVIFAVRVLIDLVFLAALLQAISSASRDAQQRDLFYRKHAIKRLDPFTEPDAFRSLVRRGADGGWERNEEKFAEFPPYDTNRLVELSSNQDERIRSAANFLLENEHDPHDPHFRLSAATAGKEIMPDAVVELLDQIESAGRTRNSYQLALARRRLLRRRDMLEVRRRIVRMIVEDQRSPERRERLIEAMIGENHEPYAQGRRVALDALAPDVGRDLRVRNAIEQVKEHDGSGVLQKLAGDILAKSPEVA